MMSLVEKIWIFSSDYRDFILFLVLFKIIALVLSTKNKTVFGSKANGDFAAFN